MSPPTTHDDLPVRLHARIAELEAAIRQLEAGLAARTEDVNATQSRLLLAQAQILELGDLLACRDTALRNLESGATGQQQILDAQLAHTNEISRQLRTREDEIATLQLKLAAAGEQAALTEKNSREALATARQSEETCRLSLKETQALLTEKQKAHAAIESTTADLRQKLAAAEQSANTQRRRAEQAETLSETKGARLLFYETHWLCRLFSPKT